MVGVLQLEEHAMQLVGDALYVLQPVREWLQLLSHADQYRAPGLWWPAVMTFPLFSPPEAIDPSGEHLHGQGVDRAEVARVRAWATARWGPKANLTRLNIAYASWRCPNCGGPLVPSGTYRRCERCRLTWHAQHSNPDGSAREGSYIDCWRVT